METFFVSLMSRFVSDGEYEVTSDRYPGFSVNQKAASEEKALKQIGCHGFLGALIAEVKNQSR